MHESPGPILVGGMGRSGTTIVSVVLDSHPRLHVAPELHFGGPENLGPRVLEALERIERAGGRERASFVARDAPALKRAVQFVVRCERAGLEPDALAALIDEQRRATGSDLESFPHRAALVAAIGEHLARAVGKPRWGFKIMGQVRFLGDFLEAWPRARVVHVVRDGRDVAASQMLDHQSWGVADVDEAAVKWLELIDTVRRQAREARDGGSTMELRYEDLVRDPRRTAGRLLEFVGEPWHDDVLAHETRPHAVMSSRVAHASAAAVAEPINDASIGRHLRDLTPAQIDAFDARAGARLAELGYAGPQA